VSTRLQAIWKQKCPVCYQGNTFRGSITMNESCPACGLRFEREQGYFLGALYVAYDLGVPILSLLTLLVWLTTNGTAGRSFLLAMVVFLPMSPVVFRYSRVIWMHLDQLIDPRAQSQDV
jgi:uncharacterized protein (DUF983 family)